jgi:N-hydroxyarylamine O-acetyltransferase
MASSAFDLDAYLVRCGYTGVRAPTLQVLRDLHLAHETHIPFENLDIQLGRPIRLDLASIQAKLVQGRRGGYCFEQNALLAAALEQLGFQVTRLAARVRLGATEPRPRTHMLLRVDVDGTPWLADVGFGTGGILQPIPLQPDQVTQQQVWSFRLGKEHDAWVLQSLTGGAWQDLYIFTLEPQYDVDYEMANHYTSTYPLSRFVQVMVVQLSTPEVRYRLYNRELQVTRGTEVSCHTIEDDEALLDVLRETFGLHFPPGTRFRCLSQ